MKHRHSGGLVRYRTRRGNIKNRKRPLHPITRKHKREGRRGSRRFLGFGKRKEKDEYTNEELDYLRDTYDKEPEEIPDYEAEEAIEDFRKDKEDEELSRKLKTKTTYKNTGFQNEIID